MNGRHSTRVISFIVLEDDGVPTNREPRQWARFHRGWRGPTAAHALHNHDAAPLSRPQGIFHAGLMARERPFVCQRVDVGLICRPAQVVHRRLRDSADFRPLLRTPVPPRMTFATRKASPLWMSH
jgi:hypothetical protein